MSSLPRIAKLAVLSIVVFVGTVLFSVSPASAAGELQCTGWTPDYDITWPQYHLQQKGMVLQGSLTGGAPAGSDLCDKAYYWPVFYAQDCGGNPWPGWNWCNCQGAGVCYPGTPSPQWCNVYQDGNGNPVVQAAKYYVYTTTGFSNDGTVCYYRLDTYGVEFYKNECDNDLDCGANSDPFCGVNENGDQVIAYTHPYCDKSGTVAKCSSKQQSKQDCSALDGPIAGCVYDQINGGYNGPYTCGGNGAIMQNYGKGVCTLVSSKPKCVNTFDKQVQVNQCLAQPSTYVYNYGAITCTLTVNYDGTCFVQNPPCGVPSCRAPTTNFYCYYNSGPGGGQECPSGTSDPYGACVNGACTLVGGACGTTDCSSCGGDGSCPSGQTNPHSKCVGGTCTSINTCGTTDCSSCQESSHYECVSGTCTSVATPGVSDCSSCGGSSCPAGETNPHSECSAVTPDHKPLAYWKFNEGSGSSTADSTGYGNVGTLMGAASFTSSAPTLKVANPYALSLTGASGTYVPTLTQDLNIPNGYGMTITAWVKANAGSYGFIVNKTYNGYNVPFSLNVGGNASAADLDGMAFYDYRGWHNSGIGGVDIRGDGQWHFITGVYDPWANALKYYVDGSLKASSGEAGGWWLPGNANPIDIGAYRNDNQYFSGSIDEVAIYNTVLTDSEIAALATGTSPTGGGGTCDVVNTCGENNCESCQASCGTNGETNPHAECVNGTCSTVTSCGATDCSACAPQTCPTGQVNPHLSCVGQSCALVDGCGVSDCSACYPECPQGQTMPYYGCLYNSCTLIYSCGTSSCLTCNPCPAGQSLPHNECINGTCASVDTCGVNDCSSCQQQAGGPYVTGLSLSEVNCTGVQGEAMIALSWTYDDQLYDDTETSFEVQIDNNQNFNNPQFTKTTNASGPGNSQQVFIRLENDETGCDANEEDCYLTYGKAYYVRVRVTGTIGGAPATSSWYYHNGNGGTTVKNNQISYSRNGKPAPFPYFTSSPSSPKAGQTVAFTDGSVCYDQFKVNHACSEILSSGYTWYFGNEGQSNTVGNVSHAFSASGSKTVTLQVCDDEHCCSYNRIVPVISNKGNLPNYKEVSPF